MLVLGIETSCDETAFGLVEDGRPRHGLLHSQTAVHALFGGVAPEIASREHYRIIGPLFDRFLEEAGCTVADLDAVAVARGPGLLGSLLVGVAFAKALCLGADLPLIGVNHLHAHLLAAALDAEPAFPALGLLVSGGHTNLYHIRSPREFAPLGRTLDDAAGEAFDKAAKMLSLPYPGGRCLDALARRARKEGWSASARDVRFPRPYLDNETLDFSFSGLKTAMGRYLETRPELKGGAPAGENWAKHPQEAPQALCETALAFTDAVVETLTAKTARALARLRKEGETIRSLIVAGGVAANSFLREAAGELAAREGVALCMPSPQLCTDNGLMIACAGWCQAQAGRFHPLEMAAVPRGCPVPDDALSSGQVLA